MHGLLERAKELAAERACTAQRVTVSFVAPKRDQPPHVRRRETAGSSCAELHGLHPGDRRRASICRATATSSSSACGRRRTCTASTRARDRIRTTSACSCSATCARGRRPKATRAELFSGIFERAFQEAARTLAPEPGHSRSAARAALEPAGDAHGASGRARRGHRAAHGAAPAVEHPPPRRREDDRALEAAQRRAAATIRRARSRSSARIWRRAGSS